MRYISSRDNYSPVESAAAINLGMVPGGGLFVPETIPHVEPGPLVGASYHEVARAILSPLLTDFTEVELRACIGRAYNPHTFDVETVVKLAEMGPRRFVMELWHGPTAAFKDVALQIMPSFLATAKEKVGEKGHTVILVATSGDTGKAALEGFRDREGISIIVFYPHGGVSEIQRLQMVTTGGANTHVVAVEGNFDDCQTGVKQLFGDESLREVLSGHHIVFSSANSINWGRLCPQIVYYYYSYLLLVSRGDISPGEPVDFCVPTGNFGNILAGYYAKRMGLPIRKLICASNRNKILADFFESGVYDRNREFYRTVSPSMDILISSNLERFLFELTGHDGKKVGAWHDRLGRTGRFAVDEATRKAMAGVIASGWVDEERVLATVKRVYEEHRYVVDTHTAVGVAVSEDRGDGSVCTIIDSTASPYKFSRDVVRGITGEAIESELQSIARLRELCGTPVHRAVDGLQGKAVRHRRVIGVGDMRDALLDILGYSASDRSAG